MPGVARDLKPGVQLIATWSARLAGHVVDLAWSGGGDAVAALSVEGDLAVIERTSGATRFTRTAHGDGASAVSWHPCLPLLATGGQDGTVRVWDTTTGAEIRALDAGATWVERAAWSPSGSFLAAAAGRTVRVWDAEGVLVREYPKHRATVTDLRWQPGHDKLCTTSYGGVTLFDPAEQAPTSLLSWQGSSLVARWSPDGKYIATGDQDSTVHFWNTRTSRDLMMSGYQHKVRELAWSHNSRLLATGGSEDVTVWDCGGKGPSGSRPMTLPGHQTRVSALSFQHAGPRLASGGDEGRVVLWQPGSKRTLVGATVLAAAVSALAWAPDDRDLLAGCANGDLRLLPNPATV